MSTTNDSTNEPLEKRASSFGKVIEPLPKSEGANPAADLIRQRLDKLYGTEPSAEEEIAEVEEITHRSKHQQYMYELSHSGKSLAEIQMDWHRYYTHLSNDEKHEVWQEFYANHDKQTTPVETKPKVIPAKQKPVEAQPAPAPVPTDTRTASDIKQQLLSKITANGKATKKDNIKSLMFGLSMGGVVMLFLLFGFFNERFIAPFITPARAVSTTPIVIDPANSAVGPEPKIIIPKINVEIPIDFEEPTIDEEAIQRSLEKGVVHYPTTPDPGQIGNGVIFGHSANNILNKGKYKFAFVLLRKLESGDVFYVQKDGKRYAYKIFDKKVVAPTEVSVLYPSYPDKPSTFTLITCDPPGTSLNRLVVVGEQISPDPGTNTANTIAAKPQAQPEELPSNSETLWQRIKNWF